jgi:hypothetical protein
MDISAGSVPPDPNLTGGMEPGMNNNIYTKYVKSKCVRIPLRNTSFLYISFKNTL